MLDPISAFGLAANIGQFYRLHMQSPLRIQRNLQISIWVIERKNRPRVDLYCAERTERKTLVALPTGRRSIKVGQQI